MNLFFLKVLRKLHIINDDQFARRRDMYIISRSSLFDKEWYLSKYSDVKAVKMDPARHYVMYGWKEGRNPSVNFDGNRYLNDNYDVKNAGVCPLVHYERFGKNEGRFCASAGTGNARFRHGKAAGSSFSEKVKYIFSYPIRLQEECNRLEREIKELEKQLI